MAKYVSNAGSDGHIFGQSSTDKVGFHGVTATVQRAGAAQAAVTTATPTVTAFGYTSAQAAALLALVNEMRTVLVEKGLMKGSS